MNYSLIFLSISLAIILMLRFRRWKAGRSLRQYTAADFQSGTTNPSGKIFLDVRTRQERSHGEIQGSLHIPLHELKARLNELNRYREHEIVCYCHSGSRSLSAASILQKRGFTTANLKGGIGAWNFQKLQSK